MSTSQRDLQVWVLAASTGGVSAVPKFLSLVPRSPRIAFVYVQHLVEEQHAHLLNIVRRHCDWPVSGVTYGLPIVGGRVMVPSADERFDIGDDGVIGVTDKAGWPAPYRPNIDDVSAQIGRCYGANAGMIVFTGMGNDGVQGALEVVRCGGKVWAQAPETCAAVSMPLSVMGRLEPGVTGDVETLAERFNQQFIPAGT